MNKNKNTDCLYNFHTRDGLLRMNATEAEKRFGRDVWDMYGEQVDHSEWCPCRKTNVGDDGALIDPFLDAFGDTEPPF